MTIWPSSPGSGETPTLTILTPIRIPSRTRSWSVIEFPLRLTFLTISRSGVLSGSNSVKGKPFKYPKLPSKMFPLRYLSKGYCYRSPIVSKGLARLLKRGLPIFITEGFFRRDEFCAHQAASFSVA